ncbi:MAG: hypothetical protein M3469_03630 [Actinomycetota bacterium]|nr:hypothetical protein [Actinomycetota bacterium]
MTVLLLAGPPAVGKNAIAGLICRQRPRAALIDVDEIRYMQRVPYADRGHPLGLGAAFWHGPIREWRDHLVAHAGSYDQPHDTGLFSAEQSAQKLAALLDR